MKMIVKLLLLWPLVNTVLHTTMFASEIHSGELMRLEHLTGKKATVHLGYAVPSVQLSELNTPFIQVQWNDSTATYGIEVMHRAPAGFMQTRIQGAIGFKLSEELQVSTYATARRYASIYNAFVAASVSTSMMYAFNDYDRIGISASHLLQVGDDLLWMYDETVAVSTRYERRISDQLNMAATVAYRTTGSMQVSIEAVFWPIESMQWLLSLSTNPLIANVRVIVHTSQTVAISCAYKTSAIGSGLSIGALFALGE